MYPQVFGKYILEGELARGGMARVLLATLRGTDGFEKRLVVKQIRDELAHDDAFVARFVTEAKMTVALSHPNIVPVYELGVEQGTYYLSMELVEGVSVSELIAQRPLSPEEGAYLGSEICRALEYAHRKWSLVHRDITPRNVMVDEEGQVKVIDFGIAARAQGGSTQAFGTLGHMPPEQMQGREATPATDVFAVAVLLLEAWSGRAPYRRRERAEVEALLAGPAPRPSAADIRLLPLDDLLVQCLAPEPAARPQPIEELGRALRRFLAGLDADEVGRGLGERVREMRKATRLVDRAPAAPVALGATSAADLSTRTFAAREEVTRWATSPPSKAHLSRASADPTGGATGDGSRPAEAEGTRRLLSQPPAAEAREVPLTREVPQTRGLEESPEVPQAGDVPQTRDVEESGQVPEVEGAPALGDESGMAAAPGPAASAVRRPAPWGVAALAVVLGASVLVFSVARSEIRGSRAAEATGREGQPTPPERQEVHGPLAAPVASVPPPLPSREDEGSLLPAAVVATATPVAPRASAAASAAASAVGAAAASPGAAAASPGAASASAIGAASASAAVRDGAHVVLLGAPGTRVFVDGTLRGTCPVRDLPLAAGSHTVRFLFEPTGESKAERVVVRPGERVTLRADFTSTVPQVRIER